MEGLLTSFQQTHPRSRPACGMHASACLLILGSVCRTFRKAHGRYCSQKLMPRRGTLNSSPGRSSSFTDRESEVHAAQTHSTTRSLDLPPFPLHLPPQTTGGPAYTGPPQWTTLSPPLTPSHLAPAVYLSLAFPSSGRLHRADTMAFSSKIAREQLGNCPGAAPACVE